MRNVRMSKIQKQIFDYVKESIIDRGYPPAVREICEAVSLKSTSSVHSHLEALEKRGYIRRDPTKPRAIEIIDDCFRLTRREAVRVPLLGTVAAGLPLYAEKDVENYYPIPSDLFRFKSGFWKRQRYHRPYSYMSFSSSSNVCFISTF